MTVSTPLSMRILSAKRPRAMVIAKLLAMTRSGWRTSHRAKESIRCADTIGAPGVGSRRRVDRRPWFVVESAPRGASMSDIPKRTRATVVPCIRYRNAPAAIEWLCHTFGFEKYLVVPGPNDTIAHAQLTF